MADPNLPAEIVDHMTHVGITLDDTQSLLVNRHGLAAYCPACHRWVDLDLARLVAQGYGALDQVETNVTTRRASQFLTAPPTRLLTQNLHSPGVVTLSRVTDIPVRSARPC